VVVTAHVRQRKPLAKLVYHFLSDAQLRRELKKHSLSTLGGRETLIKRHREYVELYNAECDREQPRPVEELRRMMNKEPGKSSGQQSIFRYDRKTDPKVIEKEQIKILKKYDSHFSSLIAQARKSRLKKLTPKKDGSSQSIGTHNTDDTPPEQSRSKEGPNNPTSEHEEVDITTPIKNKSPSKKKSPSNRKSPLKTKSPPSKKSISSQSSKRKSSQSTVTLASNGTGSFGASSDEELNQTFSKKSSSQVSKTPIKEEPYVPEEIDPFADYNDDEFLEDFFNSPHDNDDQSGMFNVQTQVCPRSEEKITNVSTATTVVIPSSLNRSTLTDLADTSTADDDDVETQPLDLFLDESPYDEVPARPTENQPSKDKEAPVTAANEVKSGGDKTADKTQGVAVGSASQNVCDDDSDAESNCSYSLMRDLPDLDIEEASSTEFNIEEASSDEEIPSSQMRGNLPDPVESSKSPPALSNGNVDDRKTPEWVDETALEDVPSSRESVIKVNHAVVTNSDRLEKSGTDHSEDMSSIRRSLGRVNPFSLDSEDLELSCDDVAANSNSSPTFRTRSSGRVDALIQENACSSDSSDGSNFGIPVLRRSHRGNKVVNEKRLPNGVPVPDIQERPKEAAVGRKRKSEEMSAEGAVRRSTRRRR